MVVVLAAVTRDPIVDMVDKVVEDQQSVREVLTY